MASEIKIMRKEEDETALHAPLDRLSYLPNELLTMVISSLSIAKAARTSTLTKSWRGLWRHAACLEFDETTMPRPSILPERQLGTSSLYGTIIEPKPPFFPKGSRIVKLNFRLMKLKILKLKNMRMSDGAINGVLCKCLGLESLSIVESKGFKTLEINDPWLKFLELGWLIVNEVDLSVKGLETLVVDSLMCPPKGLKIYTVNLRILHVSFNSISQKIRRGRRMLCQCK
ncbi:F-box protein [Arachis hypogaea]|nr:F-box protein [Arachis hypogaea]